MHELPPDETGPVPVTVTHAERRYYGVPPTGFALALAVAAIVAAIVMFATGRWPIGLILLGVGLLLVLLTVETGVFRDRAGVAADSVATRGRATTRLLALRRRVGGGHKLGKFDCFEQLLFAVEDADVRPVKLIGGAGEEVATQGAHVSEDVGHVMDRVNEHKRAH